MAKTMGFVTLGMLSANHAADCLAKHGLPLGADF
jgi:hypothetical protein